MWIYPHFDLNNTYMVTKKQLKIAWIMAAMQLFSFLMPIINYVLGNHHANKIIVMSMVMGLFSFSPLTLLLFKNKYLFSKVLNLDRVTLVTLF
ncbi:hypothetical protein EH223_03190 [candidate division KSB1 bacterium]|nr:MAG: hypothetical protein EH223_03190 [candidate division KSB1 bacterium]